MSQEHMAVKSYIKATYSKAIVVVQETDPKWNEDEIYRFLLKFYSEASIAKNASDSFDPQAAVKQLYDIGR